MSPASWYGQGPGKVTSLDALMQGVKEGEEIQ